MGLKFLYWNQYRLGNDISGTVRSTLMLWKTLLMRCTLANWTSSFMNAIKDSIFVVSSVENCFYHTKKSFKPFSLLNHQFIFLTKHVRYTQTAFSFWSLQYFGCLVLDTFPRLLNWISTSIAFKLKEKHDSLDLFSNIGVSSDVNHQWI